MVKPSNHWDQLFSRPGYAPRYPNEYVIRWMFRSFPNERAATFRLLDAGGGTGRHALLFAHHGYKSALVDFSEVAVSAAQATARDLGVDLDARVASVTALPYPDGYFDGVLSFGVLYYLRYQEMLRAIAEIERVLKTGGQAFVMVKSPFDSRAAYSERIDTYTYRVTGKPEGMTWTSELDLDLTLLDKDEIARCFSGFSVATVERSTVTHSGSRFVDDEWMVFATK